MKPRIRINSNGFMRVTEIGNARALLLHRIEDYIQANNAKVIYLSRIILLK